MLTIPENTAFRYLVGLATVIRAQNMSVNSSPFQMVS